MRGMSHDVGDRKPLLAARGPKNLRRTRQEGQACKELGTGSLQLACESQALRNRLIAGFSLLDSMQHTLSQQRKTGSAVHGAFEQLQLRDLPFRLCVVDLPGETGLDCRFISFDAVSKLLEFGQIAFGHPC